MRILYLYQYFMTRSGFTGTRSYEFARYLVRQGHDVTMLCSGLHNEERLTVPPGQTYFETEVDDIDCVPIAAACANPLKINQMGGYQRWRIFMQFARLAERVGKRLPKHDIVFATHVPLTIGLPAMAISRHFQIPFVFEVRDLWPQALINFGALKNPFAIWWMRRLERKIYQAADHIVALSPGMKQGIMSTGVSDDKVTVITNASDLDLFRPDLDRAPGRERLGLGDRFAAIYFGAIGFANGLDLVIEAARILQQRGRHDMAVVLHGDGSQRNALQQLVDRYDLNNVIFSDPVPDKSVVADLVAACDVCLTIYRASKEHTWSPNKMFDALAAGRPVIVNVPGWLTETIESNVCGRGVDPESPRELADTLEQLERDQNLRREMGNNARDLAERDFAREKLAARLEFVLQTTLDNT